MAIKPRFAVGLDLGSSMTRCLVLRLEDGLVRFGGYGAIPALGWQKGRIADSDALSESIRQAVREAEREAKVTIESVVVGIGGTHIEGLNSRGLYEFGRPREIITDDLAYAVDLAQRLRLTEDRLLLQVAPQDFTVDGRAGYRNPRGVSCARLEANVHLVTASAHDHHTLVSAVHQAHLALEETVFEPVAAAYATLLQEDRARGVALLDIGAHSTGLAVYDGEALVLAATLPIAGELLTKDVATVLHVPFEDAERLKREYGCAILGLTGDNSIIEVPSPEGRDARETSRRSLNEILEARAEEMFEHVQRELARVRMEQSLLEGIVLAGSGALLAGMCDLAEKVLNCHCRNALPLGIADLPDEINSAEWATAAGLAMWSARLKARRPPMKKTSRLAGMLK